MTVRSTITGDLTNKDLDRLAWPIAWNGTVPAEQRAAEEADLSELISDARCQLANNPDAYAVEVKDGEIIGVIVDTEDGDAP